MYKVAHRNGQEVFSEYYIDERNIETLEEAQTNACAFRESHPSSNGWFAIVSVLDEENTPVYSPDFD